MPAEVSEDIQSRPQDGTTLETTRRRGDKAHQERPKHLSGESVARRAVDSNEQAQCNSNNPPPPRNSSPRRRRPSNQATCLPDINAPRRHDHRDRSHSHGRHSGRRHHSSHGRHHRRYRHYRRHRRSSSEEHSLPSVRRDRSGRRYYSYSDTGSSGSSRQSSPSSSSSSRSSRCSHRRRRRRHSSRSSRQSVTSPRLPKTSRSAVGLPRPSPVKGRTQLMAETAIERRIMFKEEAAARLLQQLGRRFIKMNRERTKEEKQKYIMGLSRLILEELLDEHLRCDVIPDLLIEVIMQTVEGECQAISVQDRAVRDCLAVVISEAVTDLSRIVVEAEIQDFIQAFMRRRRPRNVVKLLVDDIVMEVVASYVRGIAEEAIIEKSFLYLLGRKCDDTWELIAEEVISKLSRQTAKELLFEARLDALHHKFLDEVVAGFTREIVEDTLESMYEARHNQRVKHEYDAIVSVATKTILLRMQAHLLMGMVFKRSEDLLVRLTSETIMKRLMAGRLLALHCEATERVDLMRECPALTLLFNQLTNRTAFPLLLKELQKDLPHATERVRHEEEDYRGTHT